MWETVFKYALKRVVRSYRLFIALTLGVLVATTFFASTNVAADILARDALDSSLEGVVYDFAVNSAPSNWTTDTMNEVESELNTLEEITDITRTTAFQYAYNNTETRFAIHAIEWDSDFAQGLSVVSGRNELQANETYIINGSENESLFTIDDEITVPINVWIEEQTIPEVIEWNLTIAGFIEVPADTRYGIQQNIAAGIILGPFGFSFESPYNLMLTNWNLTAKPLIDSIGQIENRTSAAVRNSYHLKIDRYSIIDPYDIQASNARIDEITRKIESRLFKYDVTVTSTLTFPLLAYSVVSLIMNLVFISLSLPIFFMAYFTGTMVSDVSYNLRRREIGLLLTKGYKRGTIRNMFLIEGTIVGAIAGAAAIFLGATVSWFVLGIEDLSLITVLENNITSAIFSVALGMILALVSVWRPANRAAKLEILDALKQYVLIEETSEYKRLLPTISLILGSYKLLVWILGINLSSFLGTISAGNLLITIFFIVWLGLDQILNFVGPLLFLYGATKIFMRGSQKFQEFIVNSGSRFFGAFGRLATRNVKRNPARNAAMVFILSLIVSYGVFAVGSLYSEYDRVERSAYYEVGADARLVLEQNTNVEDIVSNVTTYDGVESVTTEYRLTLRTGSTSFNTRGINLEEWRSIGYYELEWFLGDFNEMYDALEDEGIILSITVANDLDLVVGDTVFVSSSQSSDTYELTIVGLIGYQSILESFFAQQGLSAGGDYPSFVSNSFLNDTGFINVATPNILVNIEQGYNGTALQETAIENIDGIESTLSYTTEMADYYKRPIESGITKIRWVAIAFAVALAIIVTGLVIVLTLREKEAEIALITVRGFSKGQLFRTLMAEMLVMVIFALLIGSAVGLIQNFGNVAQLNEGETGLILSQVVLGGISGITMIGIILVVLIAAAIPVWWASRRPESKVDVLRA